MGNGLLLYLSSQPWRPINAIAHLHSVYPELRARCFMVSHHSLEAPSSHSLPPSRLSLSLGKLVYLMLTDIDLTGAPTLEATRPPDAAPSQVECYGCKWSLQEIAPLWSIAVSEDVTSYNPSNPHVCTTCHWSLSSTSSPSKETVQKAWCSCRCSSHQLCIGTLPRAWTQICCDAPQTHTITQLCQIW